MSKTCKTCKWWEDGVCDAIDRILDGPVRFEIVVKVADDHGLDSKLKTGPDFGCVHHELPKPQTQTSWLDSGDTMG